MANETILDATETCAGCGAKAMQHPWVIVQGGPDGFYHSPICNACHLTPTNRINKLKGHFFSRAMREHAVAMAGSSNIGG